MDSLAILWVNALLEVGDCLGKLTGITVELGAFVAEELDPTAFDVPFVDQVGGTPQCLLRPHVVAYLSLQRLLDLGQRSAVLLRVLLHLRARLVQRLF